MNDLVQLVLQGNRRALARLLTHVENEREGAELALADLFPHTGRAWVIGVTGAPGVGKSTLVTALAKAYRTQGKTVGILAVDPTSPFSGGAVLGDRIRMTDLAGDPGVFIRSMATRGNLGGLARTTLDAVRVLDAGGMDIICVETVGAGQGEVDIVRAAHTTVVVEAPGMGDDVQAIKAGILEIADVLVVNKADRPGVENTVRALRLMLDLGHSTTRGKLGGHHGVGAGQPTTNSHDEILWIPPIIQTTASNGKGIDDLVSAICQHRDYLEGARALAVQERQRIEIELYNRLRDTLLTRFIHALPEGALSSVVERVQTRKIAPHSAIAELLEQGENNLL